MVLPDEYDGNFLQHGIHATPRANHLWTNDAIHKTGSIQRNRLSLEENRAFEPRPQKDKIFDTSEWVPADRYT